MVYLHRTIRVRDYWIQRRNCATGVCEIPVVVMRIIQLKRFTKNCIAILFLQASNYLSKATRSHLPFQVIAYTQARSRMQMKARVSVLPTSHSRKETCSCSMVTTSSFRLLT